MYCSVVVSVLNFLKNIRSLRFQRVPYLDSLFRFLIGVPFFRFLFLGSLVGFLSWFPYPGFLFGSLFQIPYSGSLFGCLIWVHYLGPCLDTYSGSIFGQVPYLSFLFEIFLSKFQNENYNCILVEIHIKTYLSSCLWPCISDWLWKPRTS